MKYPFKLHHKRPNIALLLTLKYSSNNTENERSLQLKINLNSYSRVIEYRLDLSSSFCVTGYR